MTRYDTIKTMKNNGITEHFENVELTEEYDGYFCGVSEAITIVIFRNQSCALLLLAFVHGEAY